MQREREREREREMRAAVAAACAVVALLAAPARAQQLLGEVKAVAFNFVPKGWAPCDGTRRAPRGGLLGLRGDDTDETIDASRTGNRQIVAN